MSQLTEQEPVGLEPAIPFDSMAGFSPDHSGAAPRRPSDTSKGFGLFSSAAFYALAIFVVLNLLVSPLLVRKKAALTKSEILSSRYEAMKQGPWAWWIARAVLLKPPADLVLMGDSQINAAVFQADAYARLTPVDCAADRESISFENMLKSGTGKSHEVLNVSLGGAAASDQYLISKALFASSTPKVVVIGVSPRCFLDNSLVSASSTDPFQYFEPHVEMGSLSHLAFPDLLSEVSWYGKNNLPMWILRDRFFDLFPKEASDRSSEVEASTAKEANTNTSQMLRGIYGSSNDVKLGAFLVKPLIVPGFYDNSKEYLHRWRNWNVPAYGIQKQFFDAYLTNLRQLGIQTVVVGMPCTIENRKLLPESFWSGYRAWLSQECLAHGAIWFDLSEDPSFAQKHFLDTVHVNAFGARLLVQKIASLLITNPELSRKLNDKSLSQTHPQHL